MSDGRRLLWSSFALTACLVAVAAGLPVAQIGTLTVSADSLAVVWDPSTVKPIRESVWNDLNDYLRDDRYWLSAHPTNSSLDCAEVKQNTLAAMAGKGSGGDNWFEGRDTVGGGGHVVGEHYPAQHETILPNYLSDKKRRGTVVHEAQHHAGWGENRAEAAVACFTEGNEEDDDGDDDNGGGGGGDTGGSSGTWIWVPTEMEEVCESPDLGDWTCVWMSSGNPQNGGGYYACTGCCSTDICWDKIVEPGHWVWAET